MEPEHLLQMATDLAEANTGRFLEMPAGVRRDFAIHALMKERPGA